MLQIMLLVTIVMNSNHNVLSINPPLCLQDYYGCNCKCMAELAEYMGIAEGVTNVNILEWWVNNEDILPNWAVAYKIFFCASIMLLCL